MFERFTPGARQAVVESQVVARELGHGFIGSEHLLLAVVRTDPLTAEALEALGLAAPRLTDRLRQSAGALDDGSALRSVGIDLTEVRRQVEAQFGPGALDEPRAARGFLGLRRPRGPRGPGTHHIPFTADAKRALEQALREAIQMRSNSITACHVLLGALSVHGRAAQVVTEMGVDPRDVRRAVLDRLGHAA